MLIAFGITLAAAELMLCCMLPGYAAGLPQARRGLWVWSV